jgi:hypothetical protein
MAVPHFPAYEKPFCEKHAILFPIDDRAHIMCNVIKVDVLQGIDLPKESPIWIEEWQKFSHDPPRFS